LAVAVWRAGADWRGLRPSMTRTIAHTAVIVMACVVLAFGSVRWPVMAGHPLPSVPEILALQTTPEAAEQALAEMLALNGTPPQPDGWGPVVRRADPHTIIPQRPRLGVITYTVQAGDTVEGIALRFGVDPTTILWANPAVEDAPDMLRISQELVILPIDGVYHLVEEGDTLESIADDYDAEIEAILSCEYNGLEWPSFAIAPGMYLIVPGGEKPYVPRVVTSYTGPVPEGARGTGLFQWPVLGVITQGYWYGHRAIDIGAPTGTAVRASDGGFVSFAGWTDIGYGYLIVIDHTNGFATCRPVRRWTEDRSSGRWAVPAGPPGRTCTSRSATTCPRRIRGPTCRSWSVQAHTLRGTPSGAPLGFSTPYGATWHRPHRCGLDPSRSATPCAGSARCP